MTDVPSGGPASAAGPGDPVGDVPTDDPVADVPPGGVVTADDPVPIAQGRERTELRVENAGDRPVQVGSHFHFFEVNPALAFDREAAYGFRLAVPAGTAVRFEPGQEQTVELVAFGGDRVVRGFAGLVDGPLDDEQVRERALERAAERGYLEHDPERGDAAGTDGDGGATGSDDGGASGSETSGATGSDAGEATDSEVDDG